MVGVSLSIRWLGLFEVRLCFEWRSIVIQRVGSPSNLMVTRTGFIVIQLGSLEV